MGSWSLEGEEGEAEQAARSLAASSLTLPAPRPPHSSFGLWLDGDLHRGSSSPCQTFGNPPLVSSGQFTMVEVEVFVCQDTPPLD